MQENNPKQELGNQTMMISLMIFLFIGLLIFGRFYNKKNAEDFYKHQAQEKHKDSKGDLISFEDLANKSSGTDYVEIKGDFGTIYTPGYNAGDGFVGQYNEEEIEKKRKEKKNELKKEFPNITDEEADLVIGNINAWGWKIVEIDENGIFKYGSKYFASAKDLRKEFEKRTGSDAFTFIPKDKDNFVIPINEDDYGYELTEPSEEINNFLLNSGHGRIALLEANVVKNGGEIYIPDHHKAFGENAVSRDHYFYQTANNIYNILQGIIKQNENILTEKDKQDLERVKITFAKHGNIYKTYLIGLPNALAQKMGIGDFDLMFYFNDSKNNTSKLSDVSKNKKIFGAFGNFKTVSKYTHTTENDDNFNESKEFNFNYNDIEKEEADKLGAMVLTRRVSTFNTQVDNNIEVHVLPDGKIQNNDHILRCYTVWVDDQSLQAKFSEGRMCLVYEKDGNKFKGIVNENDTAVINSDYADEKRLITPSGYKKEDKKILSKEQEEHNRKVDIILEKYKTKEEKEILLNSKQEELKIAQSYGFASVEDWKDAIKQEEEKIKNSTPEYHPAYDFGSYISIDDTMEDRIEAFEAHIPYASE